MTALALKQTWIKAWQTGFQAGQTGGSQPFTATEGSTLLAILAGWDATRQIPMPTDASGAFKPYSNQGSTTAQQLGITGVNVQMYIGLQEHAKGGLHVIVPPSILDGAGGQNGELTMFIVETVGMPPILGVRDLVFTNTASTATTWSQVSTASAPKNTDIVIACTVYENSAAIANAVLSDPPSGWTSIGANQDGTNNVPMEACYQILTADGTQTATWSTADTNKTHHMSMMLTLMTSATAMTVSTNPIDASTSAGGFSTFTCAASGATGTAHYDWRVNDIAVGGDSATLVYKATGADSYSRVYCNITDNLGTVTTQTARLRVNRPAVRKIRRRESIGFDGDNFSFFAQGLADADFFDPFQIPPPTSAGGSPLTASISATLGPLTLAIAAADPDATSISATLGSLTASLTATNNSSASISATLGSLTASLTAADPESTSINASFGSLTFAATATVTSDANINATFGSLTVSAVANDQDSASVNATLGSVTAALAASTNSDSSISANLNSITLSIVASDPDSASVNATLGSITIDVEANVDNTASITANLGPVTASINASDPDATSISATLGSLTSSVVVSVLTTSSISATLGPLTLAVAAADPDATSISATLGPVTGSISATVITGTAVSIHATLGDVTASLVANDPESASISSQLGSLTSAIVAVSSVEASVAAMLSNITASIQANDPEATSISAQLGAISGHLDASVVVTAAIHSFIGGLTCEIDAHTTDAADRNGRIDAALSSITIAIVGEVLQRMTPFAATIVLPEKVGVILAKLDSKVVMRAAFVPPIFITLETQTFSLDTETV